MAITENNTGAQRAPVSVFILVRADARLGGFGEIFADGFVLAKELDPKVFELCYVLTGGNHALDVVVTGLKAASQLIVLIAGDGARRRVLDFTEAGVTSHVRLPPESGLLTC
jgi:hypothetical protein